LIAPVLGLQFDMSPQALWILVFALLLGTPVLSMIGAVGAALTLGLRGGGVLVSLLVLPLCIPVLIFGAGAVEAVTSGMSVVSNLSFLGAFMLFALVFTPFVAAQALRISME
jgi:heme exporter protein B